jgi:hypothetical protein
MLKLVIPLEENYNELTNEFLDKSFTLELEHSLVSLYRWEANFGKPFLNTKEKTSEETLWYVKAMALTPDVPADIYDRLKEEHIDELSAYIGAKMTATTFAKTDDRPSREIITAEIVYYWMVALNIPFECQYWHLNQLLTLIKVCNLKNQPPKKMSKNEAIQRQRDLNRQRREALGTKG